MIFLDKVVSYKSVATCMVVEKKLKFHFTDQLIRHPCDVMLYELLWFASQDLLNQMCIPAQQGDQHKQNTNSSQVSDFICHRRTLW